MGDIGVHSYYQQLIRNRIAEQYGVYEARMTDVVHILTNRGNLMDAVQLLFAVEDLQTMAFLRFPYAYKLMTRLVDNQDVMLIHDIAENHVWRIRRDTKRDEVIPRSVYVPVFAPPTEAIVIRDHAGDIVKQLLGFGT